MRPITCIKQIEITTKCNLRCKYCPHPKMQRAKEHMEMHVFEKALKWVKYFNDTGTQHEVSLTGIGEPLMHPDLFEMIIKLREVYKGKIVFSTNGLLMTEEIGAFLAKHKVLVFVSTHRPEKAGPAINICKRHGIFAAANTAFATSSLDWAGQVDWEVTAPTITCDFLRQGWGVVLADGRITTCCFDAEGKGAIGRVYDEPEPVSMDIFKLCKTCNMIVPTKIEIEHFNHMNEGGQMYAVK